MDVSLIVADGLGNEVIENVTIYDVGKPKDRISRMWRSTRLMYRKALEVNVQIYHFHDPELIPIGRNLLRQGKIVIMDAHEDLPKQLLGKPYMNAILKRTLSKAFTIYENWACRKFSAIIGATNSISEKFEKINRNVFVINNYPIIHELFSSEAENLPIKKDVCYVGGISQIRGISEIVQAAALSKSLNRLIVAGLFNDSVFREKVLKLEGWEKVDELGHIDRYRMKEILASCIAGLVTFLPQENHIDAQPNKMFEYMSAGVPVIGSYFPLWKEIIEKNNCGICVDPGNPQEIADAIDFLLCNPTVAGEMGKNGRVAVVEKYNWDVEEKKLFDLYLSL